MLALLGSIFRRKPKAEPVTLVDPQIVPLRGGYDAAGSGDWNREHWTAADNYDADSANSKSVRRGWSPGVGKSTRTTATWTGPRRPTRIT